MVKYGIIDPLKVIRTALVDAASVSSLMTTAEANNLCHSFHPGGMGGMSGIGYWRSLSYVMDQALEKGLIFIDGSGPTYATATVAASKIKKDPPTGFALVRPPGHHAVPQGPMGLCFWKCGHCGS